MILDWRNTALSIHEFIRKKVESSGMKPHLSVILVGDNPASRQYIRMKQKACEGVGMTFSLTELPEWVSENELIAKICGKMSMDLLVPILGIFFSEILIDSYRALQKGSKNFLMPTK